MLHPNFGEFLFHTLGCIVYSLKEVPQVLPPPRMQRRACPGQRVAALPRGSVRGGEAADAGPQVAVRLLAGEVAVTMMTEGRGFSNAKARRELGWELRYPSWRQGFREGLG